MVMSDAYSILAQFYDLSIDVDYKQWADYLSGLTEHFGHVPRRILDLGCGTGNLTFALAEKGYKLTGVDISPEMIKIAAAKAAERKSNIPFYQQDLRFVEFRPNSFDTIISACDVINYLLTEVELRQAFKNVHRLLESDGLWLFDLNSTFKLQEIYGNQSYADLQSDFAYFWDNQYDWEQDLCRMDLTFFVQNSKGLYERVRETHRQKLWRPEVITAVAQESGFAVEACFDFLSLDSCSEDSERWQFVVRKQK